MSKIKLRMKTLYASPIQTVDAGKVGLFDEGEAEALLAGGYATEVKEPKEAEESETIEEAEEVEKVEESKRGRKSKRGKR